MEEQQFLNRTVWNCKCHIVWIPKYRRKMLYNKVRCWVDEITRDLCRQKGVDLIESHAKSDHVYLCLSFPPK